jgi:hypothetical protein
MTEHEPSKEERRLLDAQDELQEVRERGNAVTPLLDRLHRHLSENMFAERFIQAIEQDRRRRT